MPTSCARRWSPAAPRPTASDVCYNGYRAGRPAFCIRCQRGDLLLTSPPWERLLPDCPPPIAAAASAALAACRAQWTAVDTTVLLNQVKVLDAMRAAGLAESHFAPSTGYGYSDAGRAKVDEIFARVFRAEAALVRIQFASGTHAIAAALFGALRPGDELVAAGTPYDTLQEVISQAPGSLREWGIRFREAPLDPEGLRASLSSGTSSVFLQRSGGYAQRPALPIAELGRLVAAVRSVCPQAAVIVDNCYGEFVEEQEPLEAGADLICGSLIKNPGGGLAPTGGYVAGRADLVEAAAARLTAPGIGSAVGANLGANRMLLQGLFLAPHVTGEALRGAIFTAAFFRQLGFTVRPGPEEPRTDLVQAVELGSAERLTAFCAAVQAASPVDARVRPEPWPMPGYDDPVIMAAGTFIQGSSIELSADGPMRPPFVAYLQGGLTREHVIWAAVRIAVALGRSGLLPGGGPARER
jgi:cystathionine beta-lyase family protein involved in aluminum resistance